MSDVQRQMTSHHLTLQADAQLVPAAPFHFDGTVHKPSHFPTRLYLWTPGVFYQSLRIDGRLLGVRLNEGGDGRSPRIHVALFSDGTITPALRQRAVDELSFRYALKADLREFRRVVYQDARHKAVFRRWMGSRPSTPYSLYELLVVGLVLQNAQVRRSVQMLDTLTQRFGSRLSFDEVSLEALWAPDALDGTSEDELRALRIGYRAKALKRFSAQFASGAIEEVSLRELPDEELRRALLRTYGVGPETVRILMSEAFHRESTFGHIAPWQQKVLSMLLYNKELVPAETIRRDVLRRYGQQATLAIHYLWEDLFLRHQKESIPWLAAEIRL